MAKIYRLDGVSLWPGSIFKILGLCACNTILIQVSYKQIGADNMIVMSVTDFARNMKEVLNQVEARGEEVLLVRNKKNLAKLVSQPRGNTALEVFSDLYRTLPDSAAETWLEQSRSNESAADMSDPGLQ